LDGCYFLQVILCTIIFTNVVFCHMASICRMCPHIVDVFLLFGCSPPAYYGVSQTFLDRYWSLFLRVW
jgi:hypothetical protein